MTLFQLEKNKGAQIRIDQLRDKIIKCEENATHCTSPPSSHVNSRRSGKTDKVGSNIVNKAYYQEQIDQLEDEQSATNVFLSGLSCENPMLAAILEYLYIDELSYDEVELKLVSKYPQKKIPSARQMRRMVKTHFDGTVPSAKLPGFKMSEMSEMSENGNCAEIVT